MAILLAERHPKKYEKTNALSCSQIIIEYVACVITQIGQEQSFLLVSHMRGSVLYEWMHKTVTEGTVNHPDLGINFVTCFVWASTLSHVLFGHQLCHMFCLGINFVTCFVWASTLSHVLSARV